MRPRHEALTFTDSENNTFLLVDANADGTADMQVQLVELNVQLSNSSFMIV